MIIEMFDLIFLLLHLTKFQFLVHFWTLKCPNLSHCANPKSGDVFPILPDFLMAKKLPVFQLPTLRRDFSREKKRCDDEFVVKVETFCDRNYIRRLQKLEKNNYVNCENL